MRKIRLAGSVAMSSRFMWMWGMVTQSAFMTGAFLPEILPKQGLLLKSAFRARPRLVWGTLGLFAGKGWNFPVHRLSLGWTNF